MSFLATLEADFATAEADVKKWLSEAEIEAKAVASMVWNDLKVAAVAVEGAAMTALKNAMPPLMSALAAEALACVKQAEQIVGNALSGQVKFSFALYQLWTTIKNGFIIPASTLAASTLKGLFSLATLQTLIQAAYVAFASGAAAAA